MIAPASTVAIAMCLLAAAMSQQGSRDNVAAPRGTATVTGVVYDGPTGERPARNVRVSLVSAGGNARGAIAVTTDDGRFEFRGVSAGRFTVQALKNGYLTSNLGASRPGRPGTPIAVSDGSRVDGLVIRLHRGSVVTGTVRDMRGRPVPGATVRALRIGYSASGDRRLVLGGSGSATTDDLGQYRIWGIAPGGYFVMVSASVGSLMMDPREAGFEVLTSADIERTGGPTPLRPRSSFASVFFAGGSDFSRAASINLGLGEERTGIDVRLELVQTSRLSGTVQMPDGSPAGPTVTVGLNAVGESDVMLSGVVVSGERETKVNAGRFLFQDLPPGPYRLVTKSTGTPPFVAVADVTAAGGDLEVALRLEPAPTATGRMEFDGALPVPPDKSGLTVTLLPPGVINLAQGIHGRSNPDGSISIPGIVPGTYRLLRQMSSAQLFRGWTVSSLTIGGQDALDGAITIAPHIVPEIVVTFTDRPTELRGMLEVASPRHASDFFIVVLPQDRALWNPGSRRIRNLRAAQDGSYSIANLPPGDYLVAALTDLDPEDLFDAAFLEAISGSAAKLSLVEGQTLVQNLKIG